MQGPSANFKSINLLHTNKKRILINILMLSYLFINIKSIIAELKICTAKTRKMVRIGWHKKVFNDVRMRILPPA